MFHADSAVFLRIECVRVLSQVFLHAVAECDTKLCSKVYLADSAFNGLTNCVVRYSGCAVEYERDGYDFADLA